MNLIWLAVGVFAAVVVVEIVLSARWNPTYFTAGLPIFVRRIETTRRVNELSLDELQKSAATVAATPLVFRPLSERAVAFREAFGVGAMMHYAPIMHGVIRSQDAEASIVVTGFLNWYVVAAVVILTVGMGRGIVKIAPFMLVALGVVYLIQAIRYGRVSKAIRRQAGVAP